MNAPLPSSSKSHEPIESLSRPFFWATVAGAVVWVAVIQLLIL